MRGYVSPTSSSLPQIINLVLSVAVLQHLYLHDIFLSYGTIQSKHLFSNYKKNYGRVSISVVFSTVTQTKHLLLSATQPKASNTHIVNSFVIF